MEVKDDQTLLYNYKLAYAGAQAANEILGLIDQAVEDADMLTQKMQGKKVNKFGIGRS